jgi:DNA-directed RNA polymerase beta subunit
MTHRTKIPELGKVITSFSVPWWQIPFNGTVIGISKDNFGDTIILIEYIGLPVNGDTFTTYHGQKGVVTILPDHHMPKVKGRIADLVISSSVMLKRQTASQVIEAACGMFCVEQQIESWSVSPDHVVASWNNMNSRKLRDPYDGIVRSYEGDLDVPSGEGIFEFVYRRDWTLNSNITSNSRVRVNYGMIRLAQSIFMASSKMSFTQSKVRSTSVSPISRTSMGGSKRLGEMELTQLEALGTKNCLQEFVERSEACVVEVCNICRCITNTLRLSSRL